MIPSVHSNGVVFQYCNIGRGLVDTLIQQGCILEYVRLNDAAGLLHILNVLHAIKAKIISQDVVHFSLYVWWVSGFEYGMKTIRCGYRSDEVEGCGGQEQDNVCEEAWEIVHVQETSVMVLKAVGVT
jgi:hypothetical protein